MKKTTLKLTAIVCLAAFGTSVMAGEGTFQPRTETLKVKRILSGDRVIFAGVECKIAGAVIPSNDVKKSHALAHRISPTDKVLRMATSRAGGVATAVLKKSIKKRKSYKVDIIGEVDPATVGGRKVNLCVIYDAQGEDVAKKMIAGGAGVPFWKEIPADKRAEYNQLLEAAKSVKAGMWNDPTVREYGYKVMSFLVAENAADYSK